MTFSLANVINSIAGQLKSLYPDFPVYRSPSFKTEPPCFFVFLRDSDIEDAISKRNVRTLPFNIVFLQQRNVTDQNEFLYRMLETIDENFDFLTYTDGTETCLLHCQERSGRVEDQELHYFLSIKQRTSFPGIAEEMQVLESEDVKIKIEIQH